jgi:hypothetical protein
LQIRETVSNYTLARERIDPRPAERATWATPARRRGKGIFALEGSLSESADPRTGLCADGQPARYVYSVHDIAVFLANNEWIGRGDVSDTWTVKIAGALFAVFDRLMSVKYPNCAEHPDGEAVPEISVSADRKYVEIGGVAFCPAAGAESSFPNVNVGEPFDQILRDGSGGSLGWPMEMCPSRFNAPAGGEAPSPTGPSGPRMQTNAIRYGAVALGLGLVAGVGYMIWRHAR